MLLTVQGEGACKRKAPIGFDESLKEILGYASESLESAQGFFYKLFV